MAQPGSPHLHIGFLLGPFVERAAAKTAYATRLGMHPASSIQSRVLAFPWQLQFVGLWLGPQDSLASGSCRHWNLEVDSGAVCIGGLPDLGADVIDNHLDLQLGSTIETLLRNQVALNLIRRKSAQNKVSLRVVACSFPNQAYNPAKQSSVSRAPQQRQLGRFPTQSIRGGSHVGGAKEENSRKRELACRYRLRFVSQRRAHRCFILPRRPTLLSTPNFSTIAESHPTFLFRITSLPLPQTATLPRLHLSHTALPLQGFTPHRSREFSLPSAGLRSFPLGAVGVPLCRVGDWNFRAWRGFEPLGVCVVGVSRGTKFQSQVTGGAGKSHNAVRGLEAFLHRGSFRCTAEMEGSGPCDEGSRELWVEGVGEGSTRWRSSRLRKPRNGLANWAERTIPSREHTSNEAEAGGTGELRLQDIDAMDAHEVDGGRWRRISNAEAEADLSVLRSMAETRNGTDERNIGTEEGTEVMEVTGWRNPRVVRRHAARVTGSERSALATAASAESSERPGLRHFGDLLDSRARGTEASGSRDVEVHDHSSVLGLSSDEEDGPVSGKKPVHDVIDLGGDSPLPGNGLGNEFLNLGSVRNEEAGPSQSSGQSPLRRVMQRPASADAKRARRIMHRSGVAYPEERDDEDELLTSEDPHDVIEPLGDQIPVARSIPEPHYLRRGRSLNMAASAPRSRLDGRLLNSNGSRGRLGRHRPQPGGSSGVGLSDLNNLRRPFSGPSSSGNESTDAQLNGVVNLEDQDSPTLNSMRAENPIVLEDDGESERARQLAEDERVARELQDSFTREDLGVERAPTDELLARMLQAQENSHGRGLPIEQRPVFFSPSGMRALLGGDADEREARRLFRNELAQGHVADNAASSSRIVRRAHGRNNALGRTLNAQSAPTPDIMNARHFQFPASMGLERRMDVLAALEMAFQEQVPVGLQLAHVDRDFNENDYEMLLALDTDNYRHRGASWESISQLPVTTLAPTDVTDEDCSICLETPVAGDVVRRLPCMHVFHQPCIDQWLQCQAVCPVCKAHI